MRHLAAREGVADRVTFLGTVPNDAVLELMRAHDLVVVPSRHESPEGLPMTIYEALCSRTPLLVSDHPMFERALRGAPGVAWFRAKSPGSLAERVTDVLSNPSRFFALSEGAEPAWESIQVALTYFELLDLWLSGTPHAWSKLAAHTLTNRERTDRQELTELAPASGTRASEARPEVGAPVEVPHEIVPGS
jgi:glycosyltransferase involved in cell wall biosynthesis